MNIEQANAIPLPEILQKIGCKPIKNKTPYHWYHSPFRLDRKASLLVEIDKNSWQDLGTGASGSVVEFVCTYLESCDESSTVIDALRWLSNMMLSPASVLYLSGEQINEDMSHFTLRSVSDLTHPSLIQTLKNKGINISLAKKYLKEVLIKDVSKNSVFCAIGAANVGNGYEFWNDFITGFVSPKNISFVRGRDFLPNHIHVFERYIDFLSALSREDLGILSGDVIILNSISSLPQIYPYVINYGYEKLYSWLGNSIAGNRATQSLREFCLRQGDLALRPMNKKYSPHQSVNDWHIYNLSNGKES
ncbi:MAG: hypothetical protein DI529_11430 [Chryseobacterium sp.]|nr:MAG: hypothetical protein DI529_11430 [Chryseobacterium sp.]